MAQQQCAVRSSMVTPGVAFHRVIQRALEEDKSQSQDEVQSEPLMIEGDASNLSCSDVADMVASETWRAWQPCQRIVEEGMKQLTTSQQCWHACSAHMQFPLIPPFLVLMWEQLLSAGRQFIAVSKKNMLQIAEIGRASCRERV